MKKLIDWTKESNEFERGVSAVIEALYKDNSDDYSLGVLDQCLRNAGVIQDCGECAQTLSATDSECSCGLSRAEALWDGDKCIECERAIEQTVSGWSHVDSALDKDHAAVNEEG